MTLLTVNLSDQAEIEQYLIRHGIEFNSSGSYSGPHCYFWIDADADQMIMFKLSFHTIGSISIV